MARKIPILKPQAAALAPNRALSQEVEAVVKRMAVIENTMLSPEQRTGISIQSITTDAEGLSYIANVNKKILQPPSDRWAKVAAAGFGLLTFLFFASLVAASVFGKPVPPDSRLLVIAVLAIGIALSVGFLGGTAAVSGKLEEMPWGMHPVAFQAGGGIAVFLIVFIVGYLVYVKGGDDSIIEGTVLDAASSAGIPGAKVTISTSFNSYERPASDSGNFRISDIPHLFNQQITISATAENYVPAKPQTVIVGSYVQNFKLEMNSCYNGLWRESDPSSTRSGSQWRFKLGGPNLHISRLDGLVYGDLHRRTEGSWAGGLIWKNGNKSTELTLSLANPNCEQIFTSGSGSYIRDTIE